MAYVLIIAILLVLIFISIYVFVLIKYKYLLHIKAKTIHMQKPVVLADGSTQRKAVIETKLHNNLIIQENNSRRTAYKNTIIKTGESFFDDSDMISDYYLVVIYDKHSNIPLLTARYYYNTSVIAQYLKGDSSSEIEAVLNPDELKEESVFLSDRLSGNTHAAFYRRHRNYIFMLFYLEVFIHNTSGQFILMARKERHDKLLKKYLRLGLKIVGSNTHKGRAHWILLGDVKTCYAQLKLPLQARVLLLLKKLNFI